MSCFVYFFILSFKTKIPNLFLSRVRNKTASNEILGFIRDYFKRKTSFLFKNSSQVRIISGQEEGTNAWISANYYLNYFEVNYFIFTIILQIIKKINNINKEWKQ